MRLLMVLGLVVWFAGWAFEGYYMTQRNFAWLNGAPTTKTEAQLLYASLSPSQRDCFTNVLIGDEMAVAGDTISPSQKLALAACLK